MDLIQASFVLFLSYLLTLKLSKYFKLNKKIITLVFILKTILCILYVQISTDLDFDAFGYFITALQEDYGFVNNGLIFSINKFFRTYFYFNIYSMTFLFSFIGNIGTLALASNIKTFTQNNRGLLKILCESVIFFPTLNIWSSAIGKDAITFACINLIIYALINIRSRIIILFISAIVFSAVRPFLGIVIFFSLTIAILIKANLSSFNKLFVGILSFGGLALLNYLQLNFKKYNFNGLNIFDIDFDAIALGFEYYSDVTSVGNNAIELGEMPFPLKMFSFMFRPLFFDVSSFYALIMSFENLILFLIFSYLVIEFFKYIIKKTFNLSSLSLFLSIFLSIYLAICWILYSFTIANLGTANRYKIMFLPALISLSLIIKNGENSSVNKKYLK